MIDRTAFEADIAREGYDMRETKVKPDERREMHTHEFDAKLLILEGIFILAHPDRKETFVTGETCFVPAGMVHSENGGPEGARYIAARRFVNAGTSVG